MAERLKCVFCDAPATCTGAYESQQVPTPACDECCGHGCEDGRCERLPDAPEFIHPDDRGPTSRRPGGGT